MKLKQINLIVGETILTKYEQIADHKGISLWELLDRLLDSHEAQQVAERLLIQE